MPFQKGHRLSVGNKGGGRKGYEFEKKQMEKMRKILNKALVLTEKILSNKATIKEAMAYENSLRMVLKIMDKIHANKKYLEADISGELPFKIVEIKREEEEKKEEKKDDGDEENTSEDVPPAV